MRTAPDNREAHDYAERIRRHIPNFSAKARKMVPQAKCNDARRKLASLIAQSWARQDISAAWNAVARSPLNATEKQIMFTELWG